MVSNIGQTTPDQVTPADIQRYVMDIIKMPWSGGNHKKAHEILQLERIILNQPQLAEGLTPFALDLAMQSGYQGLGSMINAAKEHLDPTAIELFAHRYAELTSPDLKKQREMATLLLSECVRAKPELAKNLTVYALNFSLNGAFPLIDIITELAPQDLDIEAINRFRADLRHIDEHDPKMQAAANLTMDVIYKARPDLRNDVSAYEPALP